MYYIKCDSAHDGKSSVLVDDIENVAVKQLLNYDIGINFVKVGLDEEVYEYGSFDFNNEQEKDLLTNWNLYNCPDMEKQYSRYLVNYYNYLIEKE